MSRFKEMLEEMEQGILDEMSKEEKTKWLQELQEGYRRSMNERLKFLEEFLDEMYLDHIDSFIYMKEPPYRFTYFCQLYHSELYEEYLTLKESE